MLAWNNNQQQSNTPKHNYRGRRILVRNRCSGQVRCSNRHIVIRCSRRNGLQSIANSIRRASHYSCDSEEQPHTSIPVKLSDSGIRTYIIAINCNPLTGIQKHIRNRCSDNNCYPTGKTGLKKVKNLLSSKNMTFWGKKFYSFFSTPGFFKLFFKLFYKTAFLRNNFSTQQLANS